MTWPNSSVHLATVPNSTIDACVSCLYEVSQTSVAALISSSLLSLPLKSWTLWLQFASPITDKTDLVSINLIVCDLFLTFVSLLTMSDIFFIHQFFQHMWSFLLSLVNYGRPLFQAVLCLERYLAVQHPIVFLRYRPLRYRVAILAPVWVSVLLISSVAFTLCATHRDYITEFLLFQYTVLLLIFLVTTLSNLFILKAVIRPPPGAGRKQKGGKAGGRRLAKKLSPNHRLKKKASFVCISVQIYGVTCYLPIVVLTFSGHIWDERRICVVYIYNLWLILISSCGFSMHHLHNMGKLTWISCCSKR